MTYPTIDEINSNPDNAPLVLGRYEETAFINRIYKEEKEEFYKIIQNLDTKKTIKGNKIPEKHMEKLTTLIDPYYLELGEGNIYEASYRIGTNMEFYANWDDYAIGWKTKGKSHHRQAIKDEILNCYDYHYALFW